MRLLKLYASFGLLLFLSLPLAADVLQLRNGRKLTGKVVRQDPNTIFFRDVNGKRSSYPKSQVRRIVYGPVPDPAVEKKRKEAERKRQEALRKKREEARRKAEERKRQEARARRLEQERIAREKREAAERAEAERKRQLLLKKEAEERRTREKAERERMAAEAARAREEKARREAEERKRLAQEKRQREEEEALLKEIEEATKPIAPAPEKKPRKQPAVAQPATEPPSDPDRGHFVFAAGLARGEFQPDLEPRFRTDRFLSNLLTTGGVALMSPWKNKSFWSVPLSARYETRRWVFAWDIFSAEIRPRYGSFLTANDTDLSGLRTDIFELERTSASRLERDQVSLRAAYEAYQSDPVSLFVEAGLRTINVEGEITSDKYNTGRSSSTVSVPGPFTANVFGSSGELVRSTGALEATAGGAELGLLARYRLGSSYEIDLGVRQYWLEGDNRVRTADIKLVDTRSRIEIPGVISVTDSSSIGSLDFREEQGKLAIVGREWNTTLNYLWTERFKIFLRFTRMSSAFEDSKVKVWRLTTNPAADPYKVELNGQTLFIRDLLYTFPGSQHSEQLRMFTLGMEHKF